MNGGIFNLGYPVHFTYKRTVSIIKHSTCCIINVSCSTWWITRAPPRAGYLWGLQEQPEQGRSPVTKRRLESNSDFESFTTNPGHFQAFLFFLDNTFFPPTIEEPKRYLLSLKVALAVL